MTVVRLSKDQAELLTQVLAENSDAETKREAVYWDENSLKQIRRLRTEIEDQLQR